MKRILTQTFRISTLLLISFSATTQNQKKLEYEAQKNLVLEQSIETLAENLEDDNADYTTLFDILSSYYEKPINLNAKNAAEELMQIGLLSDFQIQHLKDHIDKNGKLMSIYELQAIPSYDAQTIRNIMPFVNVNTEFYSPHVGFKEIIKNASNEIFLRYTRVLNDVAGEKELTDQEWTDSQNSKYLGSPDRMYLRYRFKYLTNVSLGFTAEKDQGESFFGNKRADELFDIKTQRGFDFYSAHFYMKNVGIIKRLSIGDFQAQFGQGLTFWSGLAFGKSTNIMSLKRTATGLKPYTSVDENLFLRGAGITLGVLKNFEFTAFGSKKKIDANISNSVDTSDNLDAVTVSSFQATGSHATVGELEDKQAIDETIFGGHFAFKMRKLNIGLTGTHTIYGGDIDRSFLPYQQFQFNSKTNTVIGADYNLILKNFNFFGEAARSANGGTGLVSGILASLDPRFSFTALYRNYSRDFQNLRSVAIAESSTSVNEKGLFVGIDAKINRKWTVSSYMDQFEFPWLRFQTEKPKTFGYDGLLQIRYKPSRDLDLYLRLRNRKKPINTDAEIVDIPNIVDANQWNYRFNIIYKVSKAIRLQSRVEYITYHRGGAEKENGFLIFQDINIKPLSSPVSFSLRYALFDTDSYSSRLYAYENDVLYYFTIPAYYNRGSRFYANARYTVRKGIDFWIRYARWSYNDVETIGSGLNAITGNSKHEIRAQVRFKF